MTADLPLPGMETVAEARERVMAERWERGINCPCCDQLAKVYPRTIYSTLARHLIKAWVHVRGEQPMWFHLPTAIGRQAGDAAKAAHWGLIEAMPDTVREDGGRAGWWRFTELGAAWVRGAAVVPKHAYVYDHQLLKLEGPPWTVQQALGKRFDLRELMQPVPRPPEETD